MQTSNPILNFKNIFSTFPKIHDVTRTISKHLYHPLYYLLENKILEVHYEFSPHTNHMNIFLCIPYHKSIQTMIMVFHHLQLSNQNNQYIFANRFKARSNLSLCFVIYAFDIHIAIINGVRNNAIHYSTHLYYNFWVFIFHFQSMIYVECHKEIICHSEM